MAETKNNRMLYKTEIPADWEVKNLEDIVCSKRPISYGIVQTGVPIENGVPCIRVTDIVDGAIAAANLITTSNKISQGYKRTILRKGDLVMALRGKIGSIAKINDNLVGANLTRGVALIALKDDFNSDYIKQYISSNLAKSIFERRLNGSALQELSIGVVRKTPVPLPSSYNEQRAIAKVLGAMDEAINANNQLIAQKELRKKWLMQNLLTGKKRLKGFSGEWREVKLREIFNRVTRKNKEGNTNVVTISAQRGFVRQKDFFKKEVASKVLDNYFLVKKGEFCYNKSYSKGYPKGATKRLNDFDKAVVTTLYICFGVKEVNKTSGDFFEQFFEANSLDRGLTKIAHEGGRAHGLLNVTPSDFFSIPIIIPQYEEQIAIAQILQSADRELELLRAKTDKLKEQKKGMMQVLLTGKKRLKLSEQDFKD
jgi:type I restriction enzyme S subunit